METKKHGRASLLWQLSRGFRLWWTAALTATILTTLLSYLTPQVIRVTVDSVLDNQPFDVPQLILNMINAIGGREVIRQNLIICAAAAMLCSILSGISKFFFRFTTAKAAEGMITSLRNQLYAHIQRLPYAWHVANQTGDIIQRCTSDVDVVRNFISSKLLEMVRTILLITISLSAMFAMNAKIATVSLLFMPFTAGFSAIFYSKISKNFRKTDEAEGALSATVQENLTGVRVVRAFGREAYEIGRFSEKINTYTNLWVKLSDLMAYYVGTGALLCELQIMVVTLFGTVEAVSGAITLGEFLVFVSYNSMLVWPVRGLGRILADMSKTGVSLSRILEILHVSPEINLPAAANHLLETNAFPAEEPSQNASCNFKGDIAFENVSFGYENGGDTLSNVSFTIKAGTTVGILGGTGSGKSTLTYLLDRLYDLPENQGRITIDGVDIRSIPRQLLRNNVGLVLQEPFLFSKTIEENIAIASPSRHSANLEDVRKMASIADVDDDISAFAEGYGTLVGERGVTLSGGQKQRVAIARMLMQHAPIMVFDDSLSAVDTETDLKIRQALGEQTGGSTVILISHRITTLMNADQIIVLDKGRIAEQGTHQELIAQKGIYQQIYHIQNMDDAPITDMTGGVC